MTDYLWIVFTVLAAGGQTLRNAMQRELTATVGTIGATHVRFLFGLPFAAVFLLVTLQVTGQPFPAISGKTLAWAAFGAASQFTATALLLAAMRDKSFVLITALNKLEPVHVALFGLLLLGDHLTLPLAIAIGLATAGVVAMSWPKKGATEALGLKPIILGVLAGAGFGAAAVGYRGALLSLGLGKANFILAATTTVFMGLVMQVVVLTAYLLLFDRGILVAIFKAWRPSLLAGFMGAVASEFWAFGFALESAAKVRTLALVEILFAGIVSRSLFKQSLVSREGVGILLIVLGVALLLNQ